MLGPHPRVLPIEKKQVSFLRVVTEGGYKAPEQSDTQIFMSPSSPSRVELLGRYGVRGTKNASSSSRPDSSPAGPTRREDAGRVRGRRVEAPARSGPAAGGAFGAISPLPSWPLWSRRPFPARAWPRRPRVRPFPGLRGPQLARALAHPSPTQSGVGGAWGSGGALL